MIRQAAIASRPAAIYRERMARWWQSRSVRYALLAILLLLAAVSTVQGVHNAIHRSQDFQWSGTRMLLQHVQPWQEYLDGNPHHLVREQQYPNYLPLLYVLLVPFGLLHATAANLLWALVNVVFAVVSAVLATRWYGLRGHVAFAAVCLFLMSTPVRLTLGNGQQSLLVLVLWCLSLLSLRISGKRAALAGLSYVKYSFAPPLAIYLWLRAGVRPVLVSLLPACAGLLIVWFWLDRWQGVRGLAQMVVQPLQVAKYGYYPAYGGPNFMDVLQAPLYFVFHVPLPVLDNYTLPVSLALCAVVLYTAVRGRLRDDLRCQVALLGTLSFCLFKHHSYDAVVLLFPFCYALAHWRHRAAQVVLLLLTYTFYVERLLQGHHAESLFYYTFLLLCGVAALTYRLGLLTSLDDSKLR